MSEAEHRLGLLRFLRRATPALTAVSVVLGLVFATQFLIASIGGRGGETTLATVVLFVVAGAEAVVASALARLKPAAWTLGLATFAVAAVVAAAVLLVETRALSLAYLALNLALVAVVARMRPLYTPGSEARQRALSRRESADGTTYLQGLRRNEPTHEVVLLVAFLLLVAAVTFYNGVKLYFQPDGLSTTVGTAYLGFALLQAQACYDLWVGNGRGWLLSMVLCLLATLVAAYHALIAEDMLSFAIVLFDALNVAQLYRLRKQYVGEIAIGRPPE